MFHYNLSVGIWEFGKRKFVKDFLLIFVINFPANFRKSSFLSSLINATTLDLIITSWDFDSTMFSYQLTAIDRDLFIQVINNISPM